MLGIRNLVSTIQMSHLIPWVHRNDICSSNTTKGVVTCDDRSIHTMTEVRCQENHQICACTGIRNTLACREIAVDAEDRPGSGCQVPSLITTLMTTKTHPILDCTTLSIFAVSAPSLIPLVMSVTTAAEVDQCMFTDTC